jgi:hypothetical protein
MLESVTIERNKLIEIVTANREKHVNAYTETMAEYKIKYRDRLLELHGLSERGTYDDVKLRKPRTYVDDYDRALRMLELSVDNDITVTEHSFRQLVLDQWQWQHDFTETNALYAKVKVD